MDKSDVAILMRQIKSLCLNRPLSKDQRSPSEDLSDLQDAIFFLGNCLTESLDFMQALSTGNLDVSPPGRHNLFSGCLKELHASLKHLTWQANQVAQGDYSQQVHFLGAFSDSFNTMIGQLAERESQLKQQSAVLTDTVALMKSVMDGLKDWVVVCAKETGEIIYENQFAQKFFYNVKTGAYRYKEYQAVMEYLKKYNENCGEQISEFTCPTAQKALRMRSFFIHWNGNLAYAHYIQDVTDEREYQDMAYRDELTGLYNRRYFLDVLGRFIQEKTAFCLCILDLDNLKYANDHFGHPSGDVYLKTVAQEIGLAVGDSDTCYRLGGDEFAILIPNGNHPQILQQMLLLDQRFTDLSREYPMSVSYGVVCVDEGADVQLEAVMAQADEQMYDAKKRKKQRAPR